MKPVNTTQLHTPLYCKPLLNKIHISAEIITFQPEKLIIKQTIKPGYNCLEYLKHCATFFPNNTYAFFLSSGTRFLFPYQYSAEESIKRMSGRRIRVYHLIKKSNTNNPIKIWQGFIKLQLLTKQDAENCLNILLQDPSEFFFGEGLKYIDQLGGKLFPHKPLYNFIKNLL